MAGHGAFESKNNRNRHFPALRGTLCSSTRGVWTGMSPCVGVPVVEPRVTVKIHGVYATERRAKSVPVVVRKYRLAYMHGFSTCSTGIYKSSTTKHYQILNILIF